MKKVRLAPTVTIILPDGVVVSMPCWAAYH